jgi:hypothetical protein
MVDTMSQGYPLWALYEPVDGAPVVSYVVGWERAGYGSPWKPILCPVDGSQAGDVMVKPGGPRYFDHWGLALRAANAMVEEAIEKGSKTARISPESQDHGFGGILDA